MKITGGVGIEMAHTDRTNSGRWFRTLAVKAQGRNGEGKGNSWSLLC